MKKRNNKINLKVFFDLFAIVFLTTLFILEICNIIDIHFDNKLVFDLIIILLPSIITIVSISLSLTKEKIYGVSLDDFVKLRKNSIYSFTHMVIIMSICIGLYTLFHILSADISIIVLECFAFCYSMIFSIQEIPVLVRNKKRLNAIVKYRYENENKNELFLSQSYNKTLYDIVQYMVLNDGIIVAYNSIKKNEVKNVKDYNSHLIDYLLTAQNKYFFNASEDLEVISLNLNGEYKNIEIIRAIETAYSNVEVLLSNDKAINYEKNFSTDKIYYLTRTIFVLHRLCGNLKLNKKENERLKGIVTKILLYSHTNKVTDRMLSFIVLMSIVSLKDGDVWFIKILRDNNLYPSAIFSFNNCLLGLFISIFISHILNENTDNNEKNIIITFLSEPTTGLNSDGSSWNQLIVRMIEFSNFKLIASSIIKLINIYESISESYYYFMKNMNTVDTFRNFDKIDIIDAWLEILLFCTCLDVDIEFVKNVLNKLDISAKMSFINTLSKKWIIDDQLNKNYKIEFLKNFNIFKDELFYNKEIFDFLVEYKNDYLKEDLKKRIDNDIEDIKGMKRDIENIFNKCIKENEFFDETVQLSVEKPLYICWRLEKGDLKILFDTHLKQLPDLLMSLFKKKIVSSLKPKIIYDYKLTKKQIKNIKTFSPNRHSFLNGFINNSAEDMRVIRDEIPLSKNEMLPFNLYYKDDAIKINAEYDDDKSNIRYLNDEEIDIIIDTEYQLVNGLYRFSEFSNDITRSFLLTREELKKILKSRIMYVFIVFKEEIIIDENKCLWFKLKNKT